MPAEPPPFLDKMSEKLIEKLEKLNADRIFMQFILAVHGLIHAQKVPFTTTKRTDAYQKKIKRQVQKDFREDWKQYWEEVIKKGWKEQDKIILKKDLFKIEPVPPPPHHRPRNDNLWLAIFDLRNYFIKLTGKPNMPLICDFLASKNLWKLASQGSGDKDASLNKEWDKRKYWFQDMDGGARIDTLYNYFLTNNKTITESLNTITPVKELLETSRK